ncbi:hypothetical protein [Sphingomonas sp. PAMC 26617]|uniref:hypothetical protein n=1 Tax=Sphingomonas sp. PAMC 26617 TaxID=1112216 RepID=UPI0002F94638|nr:hypothetical protein [Sphingomonas sp. PAMC 26617]
MADGNYVSTAGVTTGLDRALLVACLLRGDAIAERIQLDIEYVPEPLFHSDTPVPASEDVLAAFFEAYGANKESREAVARRFVKRLNVIILA